MSVCVFIAADCPLPEVRPPKEYPLHIDLDCGITDDGSADDNYWLLPFSDVGIYCEKQYGVTLEMYQYTEGRVQRIIDYIDDALDQVESVELWNVWLMGYWEYDDRPIIHKTAVTMDELRPDDIRELMDAKNWNNKDKERPSFYCLEIRR